jgi:hypothetical protein
MYTATPTHRLHAYVCMYMHATLPRASGLARSEQGGLMIGMGASRAARCQCCAALRWSRAPWTLASVGVRRMLVDAGAWGVERVLCLDACGLSPFNMWVTVWLIAAKPYKISTTPPTTPVRQDTFTSVRYPFYSIDNAKGKVFDVRATTLLLPYTIGLGVPRERVCVSSLCSLAREVSRPMNLAHRHQARNEQPTERDCCTSVLTIASHQTHVK